VKRYSYRLVVSQDALPAWLDVPHGHNKAPKWEDCARVFTSMLPDDGREHFGVLALDPHCNVLGGEVLSSGDIDKVMLAPRTLYQWALGVPLCGHVVVAHNHPTGDVVPSNGDKLGTRALRQAGRMLGIPVLASLVVTHLSDKWSLVDDAEQPGEPERERPDPKPVPEGGDDADDDDADDGDRPDYNGPEEEPDKQDGGEEGPEPEEGGIEPEGEPGSGGRHLDGDASLEELLGKLKRVVAR